MDNTPEKYRFTIQPDRRLGWRHFLHLFILVFLNIVLSGVALFYSLGYQINWQAGRIEQTGSITIDTTFPDFQADVFLNDQKVATTFPFRYSKIFPDQYQVAIKREGFQTWSRQVPVEANKVKAFRNVVLLASQPMIQETLNFGDRAQLQALQPDNQDILVRKNELWVNNRFITRSSEDIRSARWYPDHAHIAFQAGDQLVLLELDGVTTQSLVRLESSQSAPFLFRQNGRELLYLDGQKVKTAQLLIPSKAPVFF